MSAIGTETIEGFGASGETAQGSRERLRAGAVVLLLAALAAVPLVANDYWLNAVLIPFLIMSLTALGLNLLMGYAGQASLGSGSSGRRSSRL
jgi:branched-chain amino acid transport system permease protein